MTSAAKTSSAYKAPASHQRNTRQIHRGLLTTSIQMTENMNQKNYRYGVEIGIIIEANALIKRNMDAENGITIGINASHTQPIRSSHQLNSFARTGMNIEGSASIMENTVVTNGTTRETGAKNSQRQRQRIEAHQNQREQQIRKKQKLLKRLQFIHTRRDLLAPLRSDTQHLVQALRYRNRPQRVLHHPSHRQLQQSVQPPAPQ